MLCGAALPFRKMRVASRERHLFSLLYHTLIPKPFRSSLNLLENKAQNSRWEERKEQKSSLSSCLGRGVGRKSHQIWEEGIQKVRPLLELEINKCTQCHL